MSLFEGRASAVCRSLPPTMCFSVSPLEKTDPQIPFTRGRDVPETDPQLSSSTSSGCMRLLAAVLVFRIVEAPRFLCVIAANFMWTIVSKFIEKLLHATRGKAD